MPLPLSTPRLSRILRDNAVDILSCRASVCRDRRGDGRHYWRLYLETGSGPTRTRRRVYVGATGGPELRRAIRKARRAAWGPSGRVGDFIKAARRREAASMAEARKAARAAREALLAQTYRRRHGRRVRQRRDVPARQRRRAEFRQYGREALEEAAWPGLTAEDYERIVGAGEN